MRLITEHLNERENPQDTNCGGFAGLAIQAPGSTGTGLDQKLSQSAGNLEAQYKPYKFRLVIHMGLYLFTPSIPVLLAFLTAAE